MCVCYLSCVISFDTANSICLSFFFLELESFGMAKGFEYTKVIQ